MAYLACCALGSPTPLVLGRDAIHARTAFLRGVRGLGDNGDDSGFDLSDSAEFGDLSAPVYGPQEPSDLVPFSTFESAQQMQDASSPLQLTDETDPFATSGLTFPPGTTGIDSAGNPVNSQGQVLQSNGSISPNQAAGIASAVTALVKAATVTPSGLTVYPAPAGATLPAGAIGVNAQGQPINAAGQVMGPALSSSLFSSLTSSPTLLIGGVAILAVILIAGRK